MALRRGSFLGLVSGATLTASCSGTQSVLAPIVPAVDDAQTPFGKRGRTAVKSVIDKYFSGLVSAGHPESGKLKGFVVGVTHGPNAHYHFPYGDLTYNIGGKPVDKIEDAVFFIGSNTKVFTATLLALALGAKDASIDLSTPVSRLVPSGVSVRDHAANEVIRLWHLATHSAGYPDGTCGGHTFGDYSFASMTSFLDTFVPPYAPGVDWVYSNQAFALLGIVISNILAGGKLNQPVGKRDDWPSSYQQFWEQVDLISTPLGMTSTAVKYTPNASRVVQAYALTQSKTGFKYEAQAPPDYVLTSAGLPAGSLSSTSDDMLTFLDAQMGFTGHADLKSAIALTRTPTPAKNNLSMGLGWQIGGTSEADFYFQKNGGVPGYTSYMGVDPNPKRQWGIVVLSNTAGTNTGNNITAAGRLALGTLRGIATPTSNFPAPKTAPTCP